MEGRIKGGARNSLTASSRVKMYYLHIYTGDAVRYFEVSYQSVDRRSPGDDDEMCLRSVLLTLLYKCSPWLLFSGDDEMCLRPVLLTVAGKNEIYTGNEGNGFVQPNLRLPIHIRFLSQFSAESTKLLPSSVVGSCGVERHGIVCLEWKYSRQRV